MFVSLNPFRNDISEPPIEVNPNYIVSMTRVDQEYRIPHTEILLTTGTKLFVTQTPEEIDQAIVESYNKVAENMSSITRLMFEGLEDFDDPGFP